MILIKLIIDLLLSADLDDLLSTACVQHGESHILASLEGFLDLTGQDTLIVRGEFEVGASVATGTTHHGQETIIGNVNQLRNGQQHESKH